MVDGLKPGQRKIMYSCFKRNLRSDVKVAQLAGYVAEHSAYHHGEASLAATIVGLAQDFVGSNNVNLLVPSGALRACVQMLPVLTCVDKSNALFLGCSECFVVQHSVCMLLHAGQFGTRLQGGKDAASPRYIFTRMSPITRHLFNAADDQLLSYLNEEGQTIEPEW